MEYKNGSILRVEEVVGEIYIFDFYVLIGVDVNSIDNNFMKVEEAIGLRHFLKDNRVYYEITDIKLYMLAKIKYGI